MPAVVGAYEGAEGSTKHVWESTKLAGGPRLSHTCIASSVEPVVLTLPYAERATSRSVATSPRPPIPPAAPASLAPAVTDPRTEYDRLRSKIVASPGGSRVRRP